MPKRDFDEFPKQLVSIGFGFSFNEIKHACQSKLFENAIFIRLQKNEYKYLQRIAVELWGSAIKGPIS